MTHHPHVHMIVPGGGLSEDGTQWIACRRNFFLSVRVLSRLYRRLILEGLAKLRGAGKLQFFGDQSELANPAAFDTFLQPLRKIDWVVYAKEPFAGPKAVLAYLSRYTHRVAISNSRLIRFDAQSVTFKVEDYRVNGSRRHTTLTLGTHEFIRRFLTHILPKGQHRIRHYGFFGNGNRAENITQIRSFLGANPPGRDGAGGESDNDHAPKFLALPCPCCGGRLIIKATASITQSRRMRGSRNTTEDKTRRSRSRLRALRHGRMTASRLETVMAREDRRLFPPDTGQDKAVRGLAEAVPRPPQIGSTDRPRRKSP